MDALRFLCQKRGDQIRSIKQASLLWQIRELRHRPVLIAGLSLLLILSLWLPGKILFVQVEGNVSVPTRMILESAGESGITFGASRRDVRSEQVKNSLLQALPALSWAGVNTYGCTAVISVREREDASGTIRPNEVSSIVASMDGIVEEMTVIKGTGICKPGQAVKSGQVLISGYTDCGLIVQATRAEGEVFARTNRRIRLISPTDTLKRGRQSFQKRKISLLIGKKRINLANNSGISCRECAKIYVENYWVLPGGFVLPLALAVETWYSYETEAANWAPDLQSAAENYLLRQMVSGSIRRMDTVFSEEEGLLILDANCGCYEMIGITRTEERLSEHG
jgi:sporulation protein YqfD